ncbi:hypothetical protein K469DRAFT_718486 [Zopfia rhizophila CBS 207.26]|uniref:DUF7730 domain-containing protein n=1 Tax=Zopfia rhizophila CBS 207.26 TaxID=1314779 RepID=A0A6A6DHH9_9PEZI|nr:hypothetical protein K469DRAFT_718486 [Zopfia rhizophila CBS 207.26]
MDTSSRTVPRTRRTRSSMGAKKRRTAYLPTPEPSVLSESQRSLTVTAAASTAQAPVFSKPFPFSKLPAELRVHIYRMALQRDTPLLLHLPRPSSTEFSDDESPAASRNEEIRVGSRVYDYHDWKKGGVEGISNDAISPALLRTCSLIYKEARQVLYADNVFVLQLDSGIHTLSNLHQRSRSLIKHVSLTIPSHHDILDGFADLVRLGLRYCWGLKTLTIILPNYFPDDRFMAGTTSVYANAFHILRWLPKRCVVSLEGSVNEQIRRVVEDEGRLQNILDERSYLRRQHQMPERH